MADVKWDVNVDVESSSAKAATGHVDKLEAGLRKADASASKATAVFGKFARMLLLNAEGFHGIGAAAGEARAKTTEFLEFFGAEAALDLLKEIGEKIIDIGEEAIRSAAKAERMNRVFAIQQGGRTQGKAAQDWIEKFSKTSEFTEAENETAFINLRKHGVASQQSGLIMKAAADISAGSEDRAGTYQEAVGAFARMQATGRVQARTLMPLGIGIEDFKKMPEFKGMSNQKVNAALAKKNVNQNELFQLIMAHSGETKIGTRSADNVDLLATKMSKLEELPERFFKKLGDTKAVGELAKAIDGILSKFDPDSPDGVKIFDAIEGLTTKFADALGKINLDDVADSIQDDVIPAVEDLVDAIKPMVELFERMFRGAHKLHDLVMGPAALHDDTTPLAKQEEEFRARTFEHQYNKAGTSTGVGTLTGQKIQIHHSKMHFEKGLDDAFASGKAIDDGLADGVEANADVATEAVGTVADHMVETVKRKHKTHSPSEVFADIGAMDIAGYVGGVRGGRGEVAGAMSSTFEVPTGGARTAAGGGVGGVNVTLQTTIHIDGGRDGAAQGRKAANAYNEEMRAQVLSVLEQALASGGG